MKIPLSIRDLYNVELEKNERLKKEVDQRLRTGKNDRWHYESRLKTMESYSLKLETGRFNPVQLEDFFACTLVVENQGRISEAEVLVNELFQFKYRRPIDNSFTHKKSDSFPFDDLRLYVAYKDDPRLPATGLEGILFEIQIKTFLQHAWAIATHDLTYKSDSISWASARIAYQIKAMLEHAEASIGIAEQLSQTPELNKIDSSTERIQKVIQMITSLWTDKASLPDDLVRLAQNIDSLCYALKMRVERLKEIIEIESGKGRGVKTGNLSPYGVIVQSVFNQETERLKGYIFGPKQKFKIFWPREIEMTFDINQADANIIQT